MSSGRMVWINTGNDFTNAPAPYQNFFRPYGTIPPPGGSGDFSAFVGVEMRDSVWTLNFAGLDTDMQIECWQIVFHLQRRTPPPLQEDPRAN